MRGFDNSWIDRQMDIGDCRVAFATENGIQIKILNFLDWSTSCIFQDLTIIVSGILLGK